MKASELLQQYNNGQRNFQGKNLRGANFAENDLSGADFSRCDIRGANFAWTNLTDAKFIGAKAGLQKRWVIVRFLIFSLLCPIFLYILYIFEMSLLRGFACLYLALVLAIGECWFLAFLWGIRGSITLLSLLESESSLVPLFLFFGLLPCFVFYRTLKDDTSYLWLRKFSIALTSIGGTSFYNAKLTDADFTGALLKNTNFNQALLTHTCFKDTLKLSLARVKDTILVNPKIRKLVVTPSRGYGKDYRNVNLSGANLNEANLQNANLSGANLSEASLRRADLRQAELANINVIKADLTYAYLTGAYLEKWKMDVSTKLDNIDCQYFYHSIGQLRVFFQEQPIILFGYLLLIRKKMYRFALQILHNYNLYDFIDYCSVRYPLTGDLRHGEFTRLFEGVFDFNTIELFFEKCVNEKILKSVIEQVQKQNDNIPLELQAMEQQENVFVLKINIPIELDKDKILDDFIEVYQGKLDQSEIISKDQSKLIKSGVVDSSQSSVVVTYNFSGVKIGGDFVGRDYHGDVQHNTYNAPVGIAGGQGDITVTGSAKVSGIINEYGSEKLNDIAKELTTLLDYFEQNDYSMSQARQRIGEAKAKCPDLDKSEVLEAIILGNALLKQRLLNPSNSGKIDDLKFGLPSLEKAMQAIS